jgi:peptide chain release factor 2
MSLEPDFWKDGEKAKEILQRLSVLKEESGILKELEDEIKEVADMDKAFGQDQALAPELEEKILNLEKKINKEELRVFLSGKYDGHNAILSIFAGAGGQDSQDWATMLLRMYQRHCQNQGWQTRILEQSFGEAGGPEARIGTKSAAIEVKGRNAYGLLKRETGIHRLVRLSPFSSQSLRHTSFASIEVIPEIDDEKEINLKPEDVRVEFYRASGPGGQNVNKRETSVRVIHVPTGIVAACQVERSQGDNRKKAMAMLASRLLRLEEERKEKETKELKGEKKSASWGNQIRSYVLHPYKLVKDLRTGKETSDTEGVLNGKLDQFIEAEIKLKK